jgi:hypothetical protein
MSDTVATHRGETLSMRGIVGDLAKWAVRENKHGNPSLELVPWKPVDAGARRRLDALRSHKRMSRTASAAYCGQPASTWDHVPPRHFLARVTDIEIVTKRLVKVPSCRQCNSWLGGLLLMTIGQRREYVRDKFFQKYGHRPGRGRVTKVSKAASIVRQYRKIRQSACLYCRGPFMPHREDQIYCSRKCGAADRYQRKSQFQQKPSETETYCRNIGT